MVGDKLQKKLSDLMRMGPVDAEVKEAPAGAVTFDKMIIVWLVRGPGKRFLHQVHFWDSRTEKVIATF